MGGLNDVGKYFNRFGVSKEDIQKVFATALSSGGDFCDLFFQHKISAYTGLEDGEVNKAYGHIDFGVGIRIVKGDQVGFSFTEEINLPNMLGVARTAAAICNSQNGHVNNVLQQFNPPDYYSTQRPWHDVSIKEKVPFLQELNSHILSLDKHIIKAGLWLMNEDNYILYANSESGISYDYQPMGLLYAHCIAEKDGVREQNSNSLSARGEFGFFNRERVNKMAQTMVDDTLLLFDASKPKGGEMEVVLAAGSSGILLHEAIGHGMEADFNRKNISVFSDKIGKKVAAPFISIVDNGTNPYARGSINIDDEGVASAETTLVENGILKSYLHDRISANHYKVSPTGNGRRQSFRHVPMPRMRNTYMSNGPHHPDEIIASVKKGIYAESFTNGQVHIGGGDFTFYVKKGFLIENGKLTKPIKDVNIVGNGPEVLRNITMAGNDFKLAEGGWTCGKNGQSVPVSQGLPSVKVSGLTVGGE